MQTISVRTTQNVFIQYPLASVGDRILAFLLDRLILVVYVIVVIGLLIKVAGDFWWLYLIFLGIPALFYHLIFEISMNGQTPGKRVMNIQVVRLDGTSPTIGNYVLRWLFSLIDFYVLSGAIAVIVIAAGGKGQRVGDVVAGTTVVKLSPQAEVTSHDLLVTPENSYTPVFPQVIQLESKDIEVIQRAIEAHNNHGIEEPVMAVTEKIKTLLAIQTDMPPLQFLHTIVKDFNYLTSR